MEINFKILRNIWTVIILIAIVTIYAMIFSGDTSDDSMYKKEISGVIDDVQYGVRSEAIVKIKGQKLSLSWFGAKKDDGIVVGDSLYKAEKSKKLELHSKTANGGFICTKIYRLK